MGITFSGPGTNFDTCAAIVTSANFSQIHPTWLSNSDPQRPLLLNYEGCKQCAGTGSQLWSAQDTLSRFALWVMPAVVLIGHFHFPPLSLRNSIQVVMRLLGDPIDSMWCILIRQEVNCRLLQRAKGINDNLRFSDSLGLSPEDEDILRTSLVEAIAVIWMACEEIGWRHLSSQTFMRLEQTEINLSNTNVEVILQASRNITANRSSSKIGTWIAILGMLSALFAAYIRTWVLKIDNQTSHTIAIVLILSHYMPVVKLSGDIGVFDSSSDAVEVILQLRKNLRCHPEIVDLFPSLQFHRGMDWNTVQRGQRGLLPPPGIADWPSVAPAMGMNIIFRPTKSIDVTSSTMERSPRRFFSHRNAEIPWQLLFYSVAFVITGSFLPAFFLSYFTFSTLGFGCRCLAWTIIASSWLLSFVLNFGLRFWIKSAERLWNWTAVKDSFFAFFLIGTIVWLQVGWVNSCWCRAKVIGLGTRAFVDLFPTNAGAWHKLWLLWTLTGVGGVSFMLGMYYLVSGGQGGAAVVLNKDPEQRHENLLVIGKLQEQIDRERQRDLERSRGRRSV
ncbi:hypothetical protein F5882DRAFT_523595 [Hyaloscypha sp. PMI_1271]|nr:hypothetical protein F5882DRAFT_523595 [Hyaloscypha sp. PMI_1271]